jgi:hypothetical protein
LNFKYGLKKPILQILYESEGKDISTHGLYKKLDKIIHGENYVDGKPKISPTQYRKTLDELEKLSLICKYRIEKNLLIIL